MQMKPEAYIESGYFSAQAAELLGVDNHEIARLFRKGVLRGRKIVGGALLLDAESVQTYKNALRTSGRPWDAQTAWAALLALDGKDIDWIPYHRKRRLIQKLENISPEELIWLTRKRVASERYRVSPSFFEELKHSLALTGMSASTATDFGLVASISSVDGYTRNATRTIADFYLLQDATGNCTIRTAIDAPFDLLATSEMPASVVAADLAISLDAREKRCGLDYLGGALDAIR